MTAPTVKTAHARDAASKAEAWLASQNEAFKAAIDGAPLEETLGILTKAAVKRVTDASRCAFYIVSGEGPELSHVIGMPISYVERFGGPKIDIDSMPCGLAFDLTQPVIIPDVREDPRWKPWLPIAEDYGYRACWAYPIHIDGGKPAGVFAMYFAEPHSPTSFDLDIAETMRRAASVLISQQRAAAKISAASDALRDSENRMRVLLAELQHRVRNTLAVMKSITARTAEASSSVDEMASHLMGRIDAFARVQSAVARNPDAGIDLDMIVMDELAAHAIRGEERLTIRGPPVKLAPKAAESISLAVHELTTNAVKHGPFGKSGGRLRINWRIKRGKGDNRKLQFEWAEDGHDGELAEPARHGFGMELLTRVLPYDLGAETDVRFDQSGLRFTMQLPIHHVRGGGSRPGQFETDAVTRVVLFP